MKAKKSADATKSVPGRVEKVVQLAVLLILSACAGTGRHLMPAPNLYTQANAPELFTDLPDKLKSNQIDLLYVTDRIPETAEDGSLTYGYGRSRSASFGSAVVSLKPEMNWEAMERASVESDRSTDLTLELNSINELGRFPETPSRIITIDGLPQVHPEDVRASRETSELFRREILRRLALAPKDEILVFVHGFNNDFDDAAFTLAELWHYMGRQHVPVLYSWPAGRGGASGYIYDRESGEFTVYHLKNLIREMSSIPEIRTFHLIAHSRGTDVMSSAVRELALASRSDRGEVPGDIRNSRIILAAPDLDMDVVSQRLIAEQLWRETENITIYTNQSDKAIGLAERFFKSVKRIGRLGAEDISQEGLSSIKQFEGVSFIELMEAEQPSSSHSYFHSDPAASSDLILMVRYGMEPGVENGRPLRPVTAGFWQIEQGYPHPADSKD
jgi:esterase/lipase superfamily enzyme